MHYLQNPTCLTSFTPIEALFCANNEICHPHSTSFHPSIVCSLKNIAADFNFKLCCSRGFSFLAKRIFVSIFWHKIVDSSEYQHKTAAISSFPTKWPMLWCPNSLRQPCPSDWQVELGHCEVGATCLQCMSDIDENTQRRADSCVRGGTDSDVQWISYDWEAHAAHIKYQSHASFADNEG